MKTVRILLVDDDRHLLDFYCRVLRRRENFSVSVAESGGEAIELASDQRFDIVVCDLNMPDLSGVEVIDRLHETSPTSSFMLVTGELNLRLPTDSESSRAIACVLRKPFGTDSLLASLDGVVALRAKGDGKPRRVFNVLLVDDCDRHATTITEQLSACEQRYEVSRATTLANALSLLGERPFDIIVTELSLPDARGMDALSMLQRDTGGTPIVVIGDSDERQFAVHSVQLGAQDYLVKGEFTARSLDRALRYAIERKSTESRLSHLASSDQLTGLANRANLREQVASAVRRRGEDDCRLGLLMLNLDRFKSINDTMGCAAGDQVLVRVAERLRDTVRDVDQVARLGADEFAVLVEDFDSHEELVAPAKRIIEAIEEPFEIGGTLVSFTTAVGIATYPENGQTLDDLLRSADAAMSRVKVRGSSGYQYFDRSMHEQSVRRIRLENDLRGALARDEFELFYQPLCYAIDADAIHYESLLRWRHPELGMVSPGEFIPMLEASGDIGPVGHWVIMQACSQASAWTQRYGREFHVAVNVSVRQFEDAQFVDKVAHAIRATGIAPHALELEITESLLMRDCDAALEILETLKQMGVRLSLDDFGTGYSRLSYLARFPLDTLKIDRSVVDAIGSQQGETLVSAVIELGHALGMRVIAEGVETRDQLSFLRGRSCEWFQGYLMRRPAPPSEAIEWLEEATNFVDDQRGLRLAGT